MLVARRTWRWILSGAAMVAMAMLAGCGNNGGGNAGDGSSSSSTPAPPAAPDTFTITIIYESSTNLYKPSLLPSRLKRNPPALVRWFNNTDARLEFAFKNNAKPFNLAELPSIVVPPRAHTGWFMVRDGSNGQKDYPYQAVNGAPNLWGPPGDPLVLTDD